MVGGRDIDGDTIYVGRAEHNGYYIPCKIIPSKHVAYVAFGGEEHSKHVYEVKRIISYLIIFRIIFCHPIGSETSSFLLGSDFL